MQQPFEPLEFLNLAHDLANQGEEARFRTAINRAYYALFLIAREKTGVKGKRQVHRETINRVKRRSGYRTAGDQLDRLFRLRVTADYELLPNAPSDRDWVHNWSDARAIIARILPKLQALS